MPPKNVQSRTCRRSQRLFGKMEVADEHQLQTKTRRAVAEKCVKPSPSPSPKPSPCPTTHSPTPPLASRLRRSTRAVATVLSPKSPPKKSTNHMEGIFDSKPVTTRARRKFAKITQPQVSLREQTPPTEKLLPPPAEKKPQSPSSLRESINDDKESTPDSLIIEAAENEPQSSTSFEPLLGRDHEMPECSIASLPLTPLLTPPDAEIDTITSIKQDPQKCKTICVKLPIIPVFAPIPFTISESEKAVIQQKRKRILKAYQEKQIEAFLKAGIALQPKHTSTTNKTSSKKPERTRFQHCQKHRIQVKLDLCDGLLTIRNGRVLKRSARGIMKTKLRSMKARVMNAQCDYEKAVLPNKKRVLYNSLSTNSAKKNTASVNVVPHKLKFGSVAKNAVSNNENFKRVSHSSFASAHRINLSKLKQPLTRVSSNLPKTTKKHIELPTMLEITTKKTVTEPTVLVSPVPIIYKQPIKSKTVSRLKKLKNALKLVVKPKAILKRITKRRSIIKNAGILKSILKRSNKSKSIPSNTPSIINDCTLHPQRRRMLMLSPAPTVQSKLSTKQTAIPRAVKPANSHLFLQSSTVNDTYNITQNPKPSTPFTNVNNGNPCLSNISTLEEAPISFTIPMPKLNATKQKIRLLVKNKFGNVVDTVVNLPNNGKATDSMQISIDRALGAEHVKSVLVHQADAPVSGKILKRTVKLNDAKVPSSTFLKFAQATKTSAKSNKCNNVKKVSFLTPQLPKIASTTPVKQLSKTASTVTPRTAHSTYLTKQFQSPRHSVQKALLNSAHCCSNPFTKTLSTLNKSTDGSFKRWEPLLLNESSKLPKIVKLAAGTRFRAVTFAKEPSVNLFKVQSRGRSKSASSLPASLLPVSGVLKTVKSPCKATFLVKPPTFKSKNLVKHRGKFTDACSGKRTALVAKSTSITSKLAPRTSIANVMSAKRLESVSKLRSFSANEILTKPENLITPNSKMSNFVRVSLSEPPRLPALLSKSVVNDTKASLAPAEPSKSQTVSPIKTAKRRLVFTESTKLLAAKNAGFEKAPIRPQKTRLAFSKVCINTADASVTSSGIEKSLSSSFVKEVPSVSLAEKSNATHTVPLKLKKTSEVSTKPVSTNSKTLPTVVEAEKPLGSLELLRQKSSIKLPLTNSIHNVSLESSTNQQEDDKFEPPMKRVRATSPMSSPSAIDPLTKKSHTALRTSMRVAKFKALEELHSSSKRLKVPITSSLKSANDIVVVPTPALNVIQNEAQSTVNYPSSTNLLNYQVNDQIKIPIPVNSLSPKKFQSTVKHLLAFPQIKNSKRKAEPLSEELPFTPQTIYKPCSLKRRPMPNAILPTTAAIAKPPPKKRLKRETIVPVRIKNIKRRPVPVKRTKYRKRIVLFHNMRQNSLNVLRVPTNFNPRSFSCLEDFFTAGMVERLQKRPPIRASRILGLVDDEMMESTAEKAKEKDASSALNLKSQKNVSNLPAAVKIAEIASAEVEKESKSSTKEVEKTRRQHRNTACFNVRSGPKLTKTSTHEMKLECLKKMDELLRLEPPKFRQHGAQKLGRALPVTFRKLIAFAQEYSKWNPSQITLAVQNMKMAKFTSMTLLPKFRVRRVMQSVPKNRIRKLLPIPRSALTKVAEKMQKMKTFPKKVKKTVDKLKARTTEKKKQEPTPEKRIMTRQRQVTEQLTGKETLVKTLDKKVVQKRSKITVSQKRQIMKKAQKPVQNPLKKKVIEMPLNIRLLSRRTTRSMEKLATIRKKQTFEKLKPLTKKFQKRQKTQKPKKKSPKVKKIFQKWHKNSPHPIIKFKLLTNIKWLSFLTPCQAKCECQGFKTHHIKWTLKTRRHQVQKLNATSQCQCSHPLWMHRRKYKTSQRKKRVQLMQDISVLQKMLYREKNSEKCRIYFVLWKDLVRTCKYNLPLPRDQVRYKRFLQDQTSIRRMFNVFVNHNHACPDYYTDQHCIDLLTTINNFKLPPPDKTWLQHYSFLRRDYEGTVVEDSFKGIYRNHYVIWFTFCNIARLLQTVPTLNLIDIFGPHVFQMFYECIGLRLEERLIVNADTYVATVSALYRRFIEYVETNFFDVNEVPSLEGYCERSGPPKGLNLLKTCYRRLRIPLEGERAPAIEALDQPTGCRALDPSLRVQFLVKALDPFTVKREIVQFLAVEMLKSLFLKNQKYIFQRAVQRVNKQWNDGTTITSLQNLEKTSIEMKQQQWMSHFDTETEKKFASGTLVMMVIDSKTSYDRPIIFDFLAQFASVIHTQLPKMPRHYILRLLLNSKHKCLVLVNYNDESSPLRTWRVVGGICFRTFPSQEFSEIVFVTISTENQVHGYGTFLMNELKRYHVEHLGYQHLLTFADNNAFGYFKKQHFSTDVLIPEVQYNNFIKCYDGAKLMYCQAKVCNNQEEEDNALIFILDKIDKFEKLIVKNRDMKFKASDIFKQQGISHQPIDELFPDNVLTVPRNNSSLIRTLVALCGRRPKPAGDYVSEKKLVTTIVPQPRRKFTGINPALPRLKIKMSKAKPKAQIVYQFVGLDEYPEDRVYDEYELMRETPLEMYLEKLHPDSLKMNSVGLPMSFTSSKPKFMTIRNSPYKLTVHVYQKTKLLHAAMMRFPLSWPFHYPVDSYDAPNYAESIYMPMTLEIIGIRLRNMYYKTFEMVFADFNRIFTNCYSFNEQRGGHYYHCCYRCHQYFNRFASHVFNGYNISAFLLPMPELKTTFPQHNRKRAKVAFDSLRPYWYPDLPDSDINESTDEENIDSDDEYAKLMKAIRQIQKEEQTKLDPPLKSPVKALPKKGRSVVKPKVKSLPKPKNRPAKTRAQKAELKPKSLTKPTKIGERQADSGLSTRTRRQIQPEPTTPRVLRPRGTVIKSPPPTKQLPTKKTLSLVVSPPKSVSVERIPSLPPRTRRNAATVATMTMGKVVSKVQKNSPRKAVSVEKVTERLSKAGSKPATTRKTKVIEKATLLKSTSQSPQKKLIQTKLNFAPLQLSKQSSKKGPLKPVEKPMEKSLKPSPPLTRTALREAQQKSTLTLLEPEVTQPQEIPKKTVKRKASIKTKKTPSPSPPLTRTAAAKTKSMPLVDTETKQQRLPEPVKSFPRTKTTRTATKLQAKMMTVVAKQSPKQSTSPSRTRVIKKQQLETVTTEAKKALSPNPTLSPPRTRTAKRIVKSKSTPSESVPKSPEPIECTNKTSVKKSLSTAEAVSEEVEPPQKLASPESSQSLLLPRITRRAAHAMQAKEETKEQTPEPNASTSKKAVKSTVNADGLSALDLIVTEVPTNDSKRQPRSTVKAKRVTQQQRLRQKNTQPSKLPQIKKKLISSQMTIEVVEELKPSELVLSPPHIRITRSTAHAMEAEGEQEKLFEVLHPKQEQKKPKKATKPKPKSLAKSTEKNKPPEVVDLLLPDLEGRKLTRSKKRQQQAEHQENTSAKSAGLQTAQRHGSDVKVPLLPDSSRLKAELPKPHTKLCRVKEEPRSPSPRHTRATTRAATKASANLPSPRRRGKKR